MNKYQHIYDKLKEKVDAKLLPGFSIMVSENGKTVYKDYCNYTKDQIFRLASMTKPITAVACLKAEELGLLNINDSICKYIDGFKKMKIGKMVDGTIILDGYAKKEITIKDILRHQSGLGSDVVGNYHYDHRIQPNTLEEAINDYKNWYLDFEPASKSAYSGTTALDIVCYIIEKTSNMPYYDFLKKYILDPLNMIDTTYKLNESQKKRLAPMFGMIDEDNKRVMVPHPFSSYTGFEGMNEGYSCGAAGLFSSLDDYSNFAIMLSNKGVFNNVRVLKEESVIKMYKDTIPLPCEGVGDVVNWGYTVFVRGNIVDWSVLKRDTFGWSGAYSPHFFVNCDDHISVVMMTNLTDDGGSGSPNIKVLEQAYADIVKQENK